MLLRRSSASDRSVVLPNWGGRGKIMFVLLLAHAVTNLLLSLKNLVVDIVHVGSQLLILGEFALLLQQRYRGYFYM